jgi:hypothetical protein
MVFPTRDATAFVEPQAAAACGSCGAPVGGNFCSACGADQREGALGLLGDAGTKLHTSFPFVYWRLLLSPVKGTVAFAEDPAYRSYVSFLLSGIAIFSLLMIPIFVRSAVPASVQVSESMRTLMNVLSQVGVYVGHVITFFIAYGLFRYFAKEPRTFRAYFKFYCMAFGFIMPLYAAYEFLARSVLGGVGMSNLGEAQQLGLLVAPLTLLSTALALVFWAYFIAVHRRFWHMSLWRAGVLYFVAAVSSYQISYWLMYGVGFVTARVLVAAGIVTV